jgi:hypothetical protein
MTFLSGVYSLTGYQWNVGSLAMRVTNAIPLGCLLPYRVSMECWRFNIRPNAEGTRSSFTELTMNAAIALMASHNAAGTKAVTAMGDATRVVVRV